MPRPLTSSLFTATSQALREDARRAFMRTDVGRLVGDVQRAYRRGGRAPGQLGRALERYSRLTPQDTMRQIMAMPFGRFVREAQQYSRASGPMAALVSQLLEAWGPTGTLIRAVLGMNEAPRSGGLSQTLRQAMTLIKAFGGEVLPGTGWGSSVHDVQQGVDAAVAYLQQYAPELITPESRMGRAVGLPRGVQSSPGRSTATVQIPGGGQRRMPIDHPMITGEMVRTPYSSNVYEFGYDMDSAYLYVRFAAKDKQGVPMGPGSLYRYAGISPEQFLSLYGMRHGGHGSGPGEWVWDYLRIRGTVSGHKRDYELVGTAGEYVPRKAVVIKGPQGLEEWFVKRQVRMQDGRYVESVLPNAPAFGVGPEMTGMGAGKGAWHPLGPGGPYRPGSPGGPRGGRGPGRS